MKKFHQILTIKQKNIYFLLQCCSNIVTMATLQQGEYFLYLHVVSRHLFLNMYELFKTNRYNNNYYYFTMTELYELYRIPKLVTTYSIHDG